LKGVNRPDGIQRPRLRWSARAAQFTH
jgi:hypothetical protein